MRVLVDIVAVAVGLVAGAAVGYWIGRRWELQRRVLWTMAGVAFAAAWVVDLGGYIAGRPEVSIGSIGLMAGLVTGVKYGGFSPLRVLEPKVEAPDEGAPAPRRDDAPAPEDADASRSRQP